jgi:hypothetical protein
MTHDPQSRQTDRTAPCEVPTDERGYQPQAGPRPDFTQLKPPRGGSAIQRPQASSPPQDR